MSRSVGRPNIELTREIVVPIYHQEGNLRKAAKRLGVSPATLMRRLKEWGEERKKLCWVLPQ